MKAWSALNPGRSVGDELHRARAHEGVGQQLVGARAAAGEGDDERPAARHALADERDRLADRADLATALEEGGVGVAQQAVAELEVARDERLEALAVEVGREQLAGGGHRAELDGRRLIERGQGAEGPLEGGAPGIDAGLEDLEGLHAHGVHLQPGGEEGPDPPRYRDRVGAGHVEPHDPDLGQVRQRGGRRRIDGGEGVPVPGEAGHGGDDLLVDGRRGLDLQHDAVGGDGQHVQAQQQRRRHGQIGGMVGRDEVEVDVGERLQEGARAEAGRRGRGVGIAGQDFVADDRARRVADGLADADDRRRRAGFTGEGNLDSHPRNHRPNGPGIDPSAATLNAWASSTVR